MSNIKEDTYAQNFINSLDLPHKRLAMLLLTTKERCDEFFMTFFKKNENVLDDLYDYREYMIQTSNIDVDKFVHMCKNNNTKHTFETVFLQPLTTIDVNLIERSVSRGDNTYEQIFNSFKSNVNINILKYVL